MQRHVSGPESGGSRLYSIAELAEYLGVPSATIYGWRSLGKGPRGIRVGRWTKFRASDVERWLDSQADPPGAA